MKITNIQLLKKNQDNITYFVFFVRKLGNSNWITNTKIDGVFETFYLFRYLPIWLKKQIWGKISLVQESLCDT